jgi:hypothetical protein
MFYQRLQGHYQRLLNKNKVNQEKPVVHFTDKIELINSPGCYGVTPHRFLGNRCELINIIHMELKLHRSPIPRVNKFQQHHKK